jgi:glutathionylspermidine synthase
MVHAAEVLDSLVNRLLKNIIEGKISIPFEMGDFPLKEKIIHSKGRLMPFFWCRYDAFIRESGGVFFSEFNYDKPCAQREIAASYKLSNKNSPNENFVDDFKKGFICLWNEYRRGKQDIPEKPMVAILISTNHYEELHLSYLYSDWLEEIGFETIVAGDKNFYVEGKSVKVFDKKVDIILRQFPTEFLHEVNNSDKIIELFDEDEILIINDPRASIAQVKSLFAYLWELVLEKSEFITEEEEAVIRNTIPFTTMFNKGKLDELYENKDKYVIKSIYGRYSEEVYIGCMHSEEEWKETIQYVIGCNKPHLIQEFCAIRKEKVLRPTETGYKEADGFCNLGVYLTLGKFAGMCTRWSEDYLTRDDSIWISPIVLRKESLNLIEQEGELRGKYWDEINEEAMFEHQYTGGYGNLQETFTLDSLILSKDMYNEIEEATKAIINIFKKTRNLVKKNSELLCPVLGINDNIADFAKDDYTDLLCFIGRFDWVIDTYGRLKLLEFNSETPAGLMEATVLNELIYKRFYSDYINPNANLKEDIRDSFINIIEDCKRKHEVNNVGFVSTIYYEDLYNTSSILDIIKDLPFNFIVGEVSGLNADGGKLYLYGTPLDAVYRYYPLDWLEEDTYYRGVVESFNNNSLSINSVSTYITQSKAFMALVWELMSQNFYSSEERKCIEKYMPKTALSSKKLNVEDYCIKPFFGREGESVKFSLDSNFIYNKEENIVFQERIDIENIRLNIYNTIRRNNEIVYPIIGAYVAGDKFSGIYTRAGGRVTDCTAVYLPTYIKR